ncbi:hypothetical protein NUSPORA_00322 [Nucleospora cyclopteri]
MQLSIIETLEEKLGNSAKLSAILIQGGSAGGKSTMANHLYEYLKQSKRVALILLDSFYKATPQISSIRSQRKYDFDNPAAFDWKAFENVIESYALKRKRINKYSYDYVTMESSYVEIDNSYPEILIIEGLYSFNLFSDYCFNLNAFNCNKLLKDHDLTKAYKNNGFLLRNSFNILKIKFVLKKEIMKSIRIERDVKERFKENFEEERKSLENHFDLTIWPATEKLIQNEKVKADITVENGTFNCKKCNLIINGIFDIFGVKGERIHFYDKLGEKTIFPRILLKE